MTVLWVLARNAGREPGFGGRKPHEAGPPLDLIMNYVFSFSVDLWIEWHRIRAVLKNGTGIHFAHLTVLHCGRVRNIVNDGMQTYLLGIGCAIFTDAIVDDEEKSRIARQSFSAFRQ